MDQIQLVNNISQVTGSARLYIFFNYRWRHRKGIAIYTATEVNLHQNSQLARS
jgi:hypothetical protein